MLTVDRSLIEDFLYEVMRSLRLMLLTLMVFSLSGCLKIDIAKPVRPPTQMVPVKPTGISHMKLPVVIEPIDISQVERETPKTFGGHEDLNFPFESQLRYLFWREALKPSIDHNTINASLHSYFYLVIEERNSGARIAQCGYFNEPAQERVLNSALKLSWAPEWHVKSTLEIQTDPAPSPCKLTIFNRDVTGLIDSKLTDLTTKASQQVDNHIARITDFKPLATELWKKLRETRELSTGIWFQMHPVSAAFAPIDSVATDLASIYKLKTAIEIKAQPEITIGKEPTPDTRDLPPLGDSLTGENGFDLHVDIDLAFREANQRLAKEFPITINYGKHRVILSEPTIEPYGGQILLRLTLDNGVNKIKRPAADDVWSAIKNSTIWLTDKIAEKLWKAHGVVFLTGTPTFDSKTRDLSFPDLDFEVHTKSVLLKAIEWIFHSPLQEQLRYKARLNIGEQLDGLRKEMNKNLNRELGSKAELNGYADSVDGETIYVTDTSIKARLKATGQASLRLHP